ncbi:MAG: hypothetical protein WBH03_03465, partial [Cyclobacteriaceae bacterium]
WLTALNDASLDSVQSNALKDVFGFELRYNEQEAGLSNEARYNGNISAIVWKANNELSDNQPKRTRSYTFAFNDMGRMESADYRAYDSEAWTAETDAYDVNGPDGAQSTRVSVRQQVDNRNFDGYMIASMDPGGRHAM